MNFIYRTLILGVSSIGDTIKIGTYNFASREQKAINLYSAVGIGIILSTGIGLSSIIIWNTYGKEVKTISSANVNGSIVASFNGGIFYVENDSSYGGMFKIIQFVYYY